MQNRELRLKEARENLRLTQNELAQRLGMAQQAYQKIESGKADNIRITTLKHICRTLNISADWLLGLTE